MTKPVPSTLATEVLSQTSKAEREGDPVTALDCVSRLKISGFGFEQPSAHEMTSRIERLGSQLNGVQIHQCTEVGTSVMKAIAEHCTSLQTLDLRWSQAFSSDDLRCVARSCRQLKTVHLTGCPQNLSRRDR